MWQGVFVLLMVVFSGYCQVSEPPPPVQPINNADVKINDTQVIKCSKNATYNSCGSACRVSCQKPVQNKMCITLCVPECKCKDGYIYDEILQDCILVKDCPKNECGPNRHYETCGSACKSTCQNMKEDRPKVCTMQCVIGCACDAGYVLDEASKNCVLPDNCPKTGGSQECSVNQVPVQCENPCAPSCDDPEPTPCATLLCSPGCGCQEGYILQGDGSEDICIPQDQCKSVSSGCKENEIWKDSGADCATCQNYQFVRCAAMNESKCYCIDGHVRDNNGNCVAIESCPKLNDECTKKDPNSEYAECMGCPKSCNNWYTNIPCPKICRAGCKCKGGYVLDNSGKCVSPIRCYMTVFPLPFDPILVDSIPLPGEFSVTDFPMANANGTLISNLSFPDVSTASFSINIKGSSNVDPSKLVSSFMSTGKSSRGHGYGRHGDSKHREHHGGEKRHNHREHGQDELANREHAHGDHGHEDHGHEDHANREHANKEHSHGQHAHKRHANGHHAHKRHAHERHAHGEHSHERHAHKRHAQEHHANKRHTHEEMKNEKHHREHHHQRHHGESH